MPGAYQTPPHPLLCQTGKRNYNPPPLRVTGRWDVRGVVVCSSHFVSAASSFSCSSSAPTWGPSHGKQSSMTFFKFTQTAPVWVPSTECRPSGTGCSPWIPTSKLAPVWTSLLFHRSCQEIAPSWAFHGITDSLQCIHLRWQGVLHGLQKDLCSTLELHGLQGHTLPHCGPWAARESLLQCLLVPPCPPSLLTWVSVGLFLPQVLLVVVMMPFKI